MQDVATRVDQSCSRCGSGGPCPYGNWSAGEIWLEVERTLAGIGHCNAGPSCGPCRTQQRFVLNLMWHYGQRVYFCAEESA